MLWLLVLIFLIVLYYKNKEHYYGMAETEHDTRIITVNLAKRLYSNV